MTELSLGTCTPRQVREYVIDCIQAGLVPFVKSSPGMGKSAIIRSIATQFRLKVIDVRLSQATPEDMQGLPRFRDIAAITDEDDNVVAPARTISEFVPFDHFPLEDTPIPTGYDGWMIFFDEANSAPRAVQAAMYKITLDRMVNQSRLHPHCVIVMAGNLDTDKAIVVPLGTAMQSRLVHLKMHLKHDEFIKDVVLTQNWDQRILAYLEYKPGALYDFDPDHNGDTFCCPRTWEFMNRLISGKPVEDHKAPLYSGTITAGVATEFITFTKVFNSLPKIQDIVSDPEGTPISSDQATRFATIVHLVSHYDEKTFDRVATYVNRHTSELRVVYFRSLLVKQPQARSKPAFVKALLELSKYLHDDETLNVAA